MSLNDHEEEICESFFSNENLSKKNEISFENIPNNFNENKNFADSLNSSIPKEQFQNHSNINFIFKKNSNKNYIPNNDNDEDKIVNYSISNENIEVNKTIKNSKTTNKEQKKFSTPKTIKKPNFEELTKSYLVKDSPHKRKCNQPKKAMQFEIKENNKVSFCKNCKNKVDNANISLHALLCNPNNLEEKKYLIEKRIEEIKLKIEKFLAILNPIFQEIEENGENLEEIKNFYVMIITNFTNINENQNFEEVSEFYRDSERIEFFFKNLNENPEAKIITAIIKNMRNLIKEKSILLNNDINSSIVDFSNKKKESVYDKVKKTNFNEIGFSKFFNK